MNVPLQSLFSCQEDLVRMLCLFHLQHPLHSLRSMRLFHLQRQCLPSSSGRTPSPSDSSRASVWCPQSQQRPALRCAVSAPSARASLAPSLWASLSVWWAGCLDRARSASRAALRTACPSHCICLSHSSPNYCAFRYVGLLEIGNLSIIRNRRIN